jgi:hypothetical protein
MILCGTPVRRRMTFNAGNTARMGRQVNDQAAVRVSQRATQIAWRRRRVVSTEHREAGKSFERAVVPFRIDHAHAVPVQNQLLAEQARQPGFL